MFYPDDGEINAHVQAVYTRPSPPPILEGLDTRLVSDPQNITVRLKFAVHD